MKLGFDVDEVFSAFVRSYSELLRKMFHVPIPESSDTYPDKWDYEMEYITAEQRCKAWAYIKDPRNSFYLKQLPLPGAVDAMQLLDVASQAGNDVYFITARAGEAAKQMTEWWLKSHGMSLPTVLVASLKVPIIAALELDVYVDDKPDTLEAVKFYMPWVRTYAVDCGQNRTLTNPRIIRVKTVYDAVLSELGPQRTEERKKAA